MSSYASMSIDRRAEYYARCAPLIAADPLDFYTRAEKGRQFLASHIKHSVDVAPPATKAVSPARLEVVASRNDGSSTSLVDLAAAVLRRKILAA
jgi:hypothetical protein